MGYQINWWTWNYTFIGNLFLAGTLKSSGINWIEMYCMTKWTGVEPVDVTMTYSNIITGFQESHDVEPSWDDWLCLFRCLVSYVYTVVQFTVRLCLLELMKASFIPNINSYIVHSDIKIFYHVRLFTLEL